MAIHKAPFSPREAAMKRVSWADLLDEEAEVPPPRLRATQDPAMPFLAARTLYNDVISGRITRDLFIRRAQHLERVSPAAADLLATWLRSRDPNANPWHLKT
jgi:hypothetical protein